MYHLTILLGRIFSFFGAHCVKESKEVLDKNPFAITLFNIGLFNSVVTFLGFVKSMVQLLILIAYWSLGKSLINDTFNEVSNWIRIT